MWGKYMRSVPAGRSITGLIARADAEVGVGAAYSAALGLVGLPGFRSPENMAGALLSNNPYGPASLLTRFSVRLDSSEE